MYTSIVFTALIGFYFLYNTSAKLKPLKNTYLTDWIRAHLSISKAIGIGLLLFPVIILAIKDGIGSGLFTSALLMMTASSLIITLSPLRYIKQWYVIALFTGCLLLETTIFN
ncbi:MAG: hypothetical protein EOO02_06520 [Chitinophagaceae bacterium]|nr:MAG: hypothetical protein EOO02_06520 [Chitinophagaceae bacterium]